MKPAKIGAGIGRFALHVLWPWAAIRSSVQNLNAQRRQHQQNIVYIKNLAGKENFKATSNSAPAQSFEDTMASRPADASSLADLEKRFLRQKRLAIGTGAAFATVACYAIAKGNLLGIATLLSCLPLFFMASLSAQLRLWQLRYRRLSEKERGGLKHFMQDIDGWYWQVLDPEFGHTPGDKS